VPVSTIGGEPGGRVPVVVADKGNFQGEKPIQEKQTSTIGVKAEPGPNVFAGDPQVGAQSQVVPDQAPRVQKDVESVITSSTAKSTVQDTSSVSSLAESSSSSDSQSLVSSVSESSSHVTQTTSKDDATTQQPVGNHLKAAGPLPEADLEADRAALELFPDAI
jgi:dolichyl-phosphate-mannose-protein mannosyltransferase